MTEKISSITRGPRQSNFELLRIIAMFMVLTVHADYQVFHQPTAEMVKTRFLDALTINFFESAAIIGVNVFVLISGWFGIKSSLRGFLNFIFQVLFFNFLWVAYFLISGELSFSPKLITNALLITANNWFVTCYAVLYIFSPILNFYLDNTPKRRQALLLLAFFAAQTLWGCIYRNEAFNFGYSTSSFIGIYLLAGFVRRYKLDCYSAIGGVIAYLSITLFITVVLLVAENFGFQFGVVLLNYNNPLVVASSLALLLAFSKMNLGYSKIINFIAASSFAVYLFHGTPTLFGLNPYADFVEQANRIGGFLAIAILLICVFACSVILDQPRKWLWKFLSSKIKF